MKIETIGWIMFAFMSVSYFAGCIILPFNVVLRSGKFGRGVLVAWLAATVFAFAGMMMSQLFLRSVDARLLDFCPDGTHFLAAAFFGWMNGLIVCTPALIIQRRRIRIQEKHNKASEVTVANAPEPQG
jgi:hypothetical protein